MSSLAISTTLLDNHNKPFHDEKLNEAFVGLSLEGIKPTDELMADFHLIDEGIMTHDEAIERAIIRARKIDASKMNLSSTIHHIHP